MGLNVATVLFFAKLGIKHYKDDDYSLKSFADDLISEFGDSVGNQMYDLISHSKEILSDDNLSKLQIPRDKYDFVRTNMQDIFGHTKIREEMILNENCNVSDIADFMIDSSDEYKRRTYSFDGEETELLKKTLKYIIDCSITTLKANPNFIFDVLFDIKDTVNKRSEAIIENDNSNFEKMCELLKMEADRVIAELRPPVPPKQSSIGIDDLCDTIKLTEGRL